MRASPLWLLALLALAACRTTDPSEASSGEPPLAADATATDLAFVLEGRGYALQYRGLTRPLFTEVPAREYVVEGLGNDRALLLVYEYPSAEEARAGVRDVARNAARGVADNVTRTGTGYGVNPPTISQQERLTVYQSGTLVVAYFGTGAEPELRSLLGPPAE